MGFGRSVAANVQVKSVVGQPVVSRSGSVNTWVSGGFLADTLLRGTVTAIEGRDQIPEEFALYQNYPNPFNPSTAIRFALPAEGHVTLAVHNILGQVVQTLVDEVMAPGVYTVRFEAHDFASGVYFCTMRAGTFVQTRKLIVLR